MTAMGYNIEGLGSSRFGSRRERLWFEAFGRICPLTAAPLPSPLLIIKHGRINFTIFIGVFLSRVCATAGFEGELFFLGAHFRASVEGLCVTAAGWKLQR